MRAMGAAIWVALVAIGLAPLSLGAQPQPSGPPPEIKGWRAVRIAEGIEHPWGMAWLPDGRALVTAKGGQLHLLADGRPRRVEMQGLPRVFAEPGCASLLAVGTVVLTGTVDPAGELYRLGLLTTGFCLLAFLVLGTPWLLFVAR